MQSIVDPGVPPNPERNPLEKLYALASELSKDKQPRLLKIIAELENLPHAGQNVLILQDNSERMQAEVRLREQQQLIDSVIAIAPVIFFKVNRLGVIETSIGNSPAAVKEGTNPVGKSIYQVYKYAPQILEHFERAMQGQSGMYTVELDGRVYYTSYSPVQNGTEDISGMIGVAYDLTEYHQVVEALNQSEARFRAIFEQANVGIKLLDLQGRIVTSNPAFQKMLGYSAQELREMTYLDLTAPMDRWRHKALLDELLAGERDQFRIEKRYLCKDNSLIWGSLSMSLFRDKEGRAAYAIGMVENVTNQKQITAELTEVQRRLIDSRENERLFLAQELHDGPLQELQALQFLFAELEQDNGCSASLEEGRETVQRVSGALRGICGNLRPPTLAPFGLEKALRSYLDDFRERHPELQVDADLMSDGQALPEQVRLTLYRIFQNAMTNVVKHAAAQQVWVQFHLDDEQIRLEVRDDGRGFKVPARLVELVRQGHFGLVGSIERAEAIGGKLLVHSEPSQGTQIKIIIPRQESYQPAPMEGYLRLN